MFNLKVTESLYEVGSLSPAKDLAGFELGTFWFWLQRLNPLDHSNISYVF